jgi:hypothetical protein
MAIRVSDKRKKFKLVYCGASFAAAERAGLEFWRTASVKAKAQAMRELVEQAAMMKGIPAHALRLLRSTAIIKRS